jgi:hypothetical protein
MPPVKLFSDREDPKRGFNMALYIKNATVLDWKTFILTKGHLKINRDSDPSIEFITSCPAEAYDGEGKIITKSFACAHHHAYSALACGMPAPLRQPRWLDKKPTGDNPRFCPCKALACARNGNVYHRSPCFTLCDFRFSGYDRCSF